MDHDEKVKYARDLKFRLEKARANFADPDGLKNIIAIKEGMCDFVDLLCSDDFENRRINNSEILFFKIIPKNTLNKAVFCAV